MSTDTTSRFSSVIAAHLALFPPTVARGVRRGKPGTLVDEDFSTTITNGSS